VKDFKTFLMEKYGSVSEAADSIDEAQSSAYDRGDADAYYGRKAKPHKMVDGKRVEDDLSDEEVKDYHKGYSENPSGTKSWE
jgi:hypothetical protein